MNRNGEIGIYDASGRERERHTRWSTARSSAVTERRLR